MKNARVSRQPVVGCNSGFSLVEMLMVVVIIGVIAFFSIHSYFGSLDKVADAHRYQEVCRVEVYDICPEKDGELVVTILDEQGKGVVNARLLTDQNYRYSSSILDSGFAINQWSVEYGIKKFPDISIKAGDTSILWRRVTTYKVEGQPDIVETSGYYVGELPLGLEKVPPPLRLTNPMFDAAKGR